MKRLIAKHQKSKPTGLRTLQRRCYKSEQAVLITEVCVSSSMAAQKRPSEAAGGKRQVEHNTNLGIFILNLTVEHGATNNSDAVFVDF